MYKSRDLDIYLTAHHYISPKNEPSNLNFPHMAARAHMCATYSTIGAFKIGLGNHYLHSPLPFALPYVKKSRPTSAISSPVQIAFCPCLIHAFSWLDHALARWISPLPQCLGGTNPLPMRISLPFPNFHNAEKCLCAQAGGHFCLTCRATMTASPCNFPSVSMRRQHGWGLFPLKSKKNTLLQLQRSQEREINGSKTTNYRAQVIIGCLSSNLRAFKE